MKKSSARRAVPRGCRCTIVIHEASSLLYSARQGVKTSSESVCGSTEMSTAVRRFPRWESSGPSYSWKHFEPRRKFATGCGNKYTSTCAARPCRGPRRNFKRGVLLRIPSKVCVSSSVHVHSSLSFLSQCI